MALDIGSDVLSYVLEELGEPYYAPPRVLKELVCAGRLGQKTGRDSTSARKNPEGVRVVNVSA